MKNYFLILWAFSTITSIAMVSCANQNAEKEKSSEANEQSNGSVTYTLDDASYNFNLTITFYNGGRNSLTTSEKTKIGHYLNNRFSDKKFSRISRIDAAFGYDANELLKEKLNLYGYGLDSESNEIPIAFVFNADGDGRGNKSPIGPGSGIEHSCTGAPPSICCDFLWSESDSSNRSWIIGCQANTSSEDCKDANGSCNHTIATKD